VKSGFVSNQDVRLHYLAVGDEGQPVLLAPGLTDSAEDYTDILEALEPRRAVAMSFRGQGQSTLPPTGFDLPDYASDIASVIDGLDLDDVVLFAHSRAVPYAIAYAAEQDERLAALVLGDSGATHRAYSPEWVEQFLQTTWRGQQVSERISRDRLERIQREAREVELWGSLATLSLPRVAVLAGTHPADILAEVTRRFEETGTNVIVFADSDHALWEPDLSRFLSVLRDAAT
jgi:pimeloyl-ACP methyl ester carboxylesterase